MSKDWDRALPDKKIWVECLRVLKGGAFAFVMSIPRADCLSRMIISLEDAGFKVNFSPLIHCFASGFPKSARLNRSPKFCQCAVTGHNAVNKDPELVKGDHIGKVVSLEYNDHSQADGQHLNYKPPTSQGDYPSNPLCDGLPHLSVMGDQDIALQQEYAQEHSHSAEHGDGRASESLHTPSRVQYNDHLSNQDCSLHADSESDIGECNLENTGISGDVPIPKDTSKLADHKLDTVSQSSLSTPPISNYTTGFPTCQVCGKPKADGAYCGAQFKPAWETIIVAMKPLAKDCKTYVDQALKNRHGITWLDEGRIPYLGSEDNKECNRGNKRPIGDGYSENTAFKIECENREAKTAQGRFPANLCCGSGIDVNLEALLEAKHKLV